MQHTAVTFNNASEAQSEMLVAILSVQGYTGFEEEGTVLKAYIPSDLFDQSVIDALPEIASLDHNLQHIEEENWNAVWEADFEPVAVDHPVTKEPFAFIRAGFHHADPRYVHDVIVTPKMSFGTGHHATTYLMVQQMANIDFAGKTVIDFGTGTGILAILAEKLGAANITAVDCDDWSINNAKENLDINKCTKYKLIKAETIPGTEKAEIILANINLNIIAENFEAIKAAALPNAEILFSGIMHHDEENILNKIKAGGLEIKNVYKKENWLAVYTLT